MLIRFTAAASKQVPAPLRHL